MQRAPLQSGALLLGVRVRLRSYRPHVGGTEGPSEEEEPGSDQPDGLVPPVLKARQPARKPAQPSPAQPQPSPQARSDTPPA